MRRLILAAAVAPCLAASTAAAQRPDFAAFDAYVAKAVKAWNVPGLAIAITVLGLNLLGDGLRDVFDPRMKIQQG